MSNSIRFTKLRCSLNSITTENIIFCFVEMLLQANENISSLQKIKINFFFNRINKFEKRKTTTKLLSNLQFKMTFQKKKAKLQVTALDIPINYVTMYRQTSIHRPFYLRNVFFSFLPQSAKLNSPNCVDFFCSAMFTFSSSDVIGRFEVAATNQNRSVSLRHQNFHFSYQTIGQSQSTNFLI